MSQNNSHNIKRYAVVPLALFLLGFSTLAQGQLFFPNQEAALSHRAIRGGADISATAISAVDRSETFARDK